MICKKCNAELKDDVKFCTVCGASVTEEVPHNTDAKIKSYCKKCDAPILEGMDSCPICLTTVEENNQPASPAPVEQQQSVQPKQIKRTFTVKPGKGGGWIILAKIILWLVFAGIILVGVCSGVMLILTGSTGNDLNMNMYPDGYYYYYSPEAIRVEASYAIILGIGIIIGSVILAFITVCSGFLAIDACLNLKNINDNLTELIKINAETGNTTEKINAAILELMKKK